MQPDHFSTQNVRIAELVSEFLGEINITVCPTAILQLNVHDTVSSAYAERHAIKCAPFLDHAIVDRFLPLTSRECDDNGAGNIFLREGNEFARCIVCRQSSIKRLEMLLNLVGDVAATDLLDPVDDFRDGLDVNGDGEYGTAFFEFRKMYA